MHPSVMTYVQEEVVKLGIADANVLEVGSMNYNGTVRPIFSGPYLGVDMLDGPDVDLVAFADDLPFEDGTYDVVVSTEMLEHDTRPWRSVAEMARVLKPGGYMILTARGYDTTGCFAVHGFPHDYWRYSTGGMQILMEDAGLEVIRCEYDPYPDHQGVFATGRKLDA